VMDRDRQAPRLLDEVNRTMLHPGQVREKTWMGAAPVLWSLGTTLNVLPAFLQLWGHRTLHATSACLQSTNVSQIQGTRSHQTHPGSPVLDRNA
jgi:hypothetical protein